MNRLTHPTQALFAALLAAGLPLTASAVDVQFTLDAGGNVSGLTIDDDNDFGTTGDQSVYGSSDIVGASLSDYDDSTSAEYIVPGGNGMLATPSSALSDNSIYTGFLNPDTFEITFNSAVVNGIGYDIIVVDYGGSSDGLVMTANGVTSAQGTGDTTNQQNFAFADGASNPSGTDVAFDRYDDGSVSTVAGLDSATFSSNGSLDQGAAYAYLFDLSNFGVAVGDSVTTVSFNAGNSADPMWVAGLTNPIPEPASVALLGLGGLAMLGRRRRSA